MSFHVFSEAFSLSLSHLTYIFATVLCVMLDMCESRYTSPHMVIQLAQRFVEKIKIFANNLTVAIIICQLLMYV